MLSWLFYLKLSESRGFPRGSVVKNTPANVGDPGSIPGQGRPPAHSCILAWKVPWTESSDGLQSMGLQRVRHDLAIKEQVNQKINKCINI